MRPLTTGMTPDEAFTPNGNPYQHDYPDYPRACEDCDNEATCTCPCCTHTRDALCADCCAKRGQCDVCHTCRASAA